MPLPADKPVCHVGIVFALPIEAGGLVDRLKGVIRTDGHGFVAREGGLDGKRLVLLESGTGMKRAAEGTRALIAGHRPQWVISAGFAGGLDPQLALGALVLPDRIVSPAGHELEIDVAYHASESEKQPQVHVGRLLTTDRIIREAAEKRALGERHQAIAVDMESAAVAKVCQDEKVRLLAVRIISDPVDRDLPPEIANLVRQRTTAGRLGAAAGAIFRRPSSVKDMWQLKEDALQASERLAAFLVELIGKLE